MRKRVKILNGKKKFREAFGKNLAVTIEGELWN